MKSTHTYAILEISTSAFDEIKALLAAAGYEHAFHDDVVDMHGIAIRAKPAPKPAPGPAPGTPTCRSCGAAIEWATSAQKGKPIPLDVEPCVDGNLVVVNGVAYSATDAEPKLPRRKSHFATCPQAAKWRKAKK